MPFPTFSNLESAALLLGFKLAIIIFQFFKDTGIIFLPFISLVIRVYQNMSTYDTKYKFGDHVLGEFLTMFGIVLACLIPFFDVGVKQVAMNDNCEAGTTRSVYHDDLGAVNTSPTVGAPRTSLMWHIAYLLGGGANSQIIDGVPCYTDNHYINALLTSQTISNPRLRAEYNYFRRSCYAPALNKYAEVGPGGDERDQLGYVGAEWFLDPNNPGYYHDCTTTSSDPASACHWNHRNSPSDGLTRWSNKRGQSDETKNQGWPTCAEWWQGDGDNIGLQQMLFEEATDINRLKGISKAAALKDKDAVIKAMLNNVKGDRVLNTTGDVEAAIAYGFNITSTVFNPIDKFNSLAQTLAQAYIIKKIMAIAQPFLLLALMFYFPLFFVVSGYSVRGFFTYAMVVLAIKAIPVIIVVSNYTTNSLGGMGIGFGGDIAGALGGGLIDRLIFEFVAMWFPIVLFLVLLVVLGWAGHKAGGFIEAGLSGAGPESRASGSLIGGSSTRK